MTAFAGHDPLSSSKAVYDNPNGVAPADRLYAADAALDKAVGGGVTNKALTSNVATLTTNSAHGLSVGAQVLVAGVDATFNGTYTVTAVTSTTLSYAKTHADVVSASATGTVSTNNGKPDVYGENLAAYASTPGAAARANGYPQAT